MRVTNLKLNEMIEQEMEINAKFIIVRCVIYWLTYI